MIVGKHAVRRYKKRIGKKNASRKRIVRDIQKQVMNHAINRYTINDSGQYRIETPKFIAVCHKNTIITILDK
jgi:single-stranded DNA-specific DHH superfamily exonuclease